MARASEGEKDPLWVPQPGGGPNVLNLKWIIQFPPKSGADSNVHFESHNHKFQTGVCLMETQSVMKCIK